MLQAKPRSYITPPEIAAKDRDAKCRVTPPPPPKPLAAGTIFEKTFKGCERGPACYTFLARHATSYGFKRPIQSSSSDLPGARSQECVAVMGTGNLGH